MAAGFTDALVLDSSTAPWLNPGYWAVVSRTAHATKEAAVASCATFGRTPSGGCYARQVHT